MATCEVSKQFARLHLDLLGVQGNYTGCCLSCSANLETRKAILNRSNKNGSARQREIEETAVNMNGAYAELFRG
ncbi:hypothetical protein RRG08_051999 [Elysia crispata]|uniref:Uncharacterized protein n=1 Tax=Elysia crispata TaxID=231223 RepID=A0AAE0ZCU9_9GAST|nr:hypothetical protein RRG08_051999 [Elysia crispata]